MKFDFGIAMYITFLQQGLFCESEQVELYNIRFLPVKNDYK